MTYFYDYLARQQAAYDSIPLAQVAHVADLIKTGWQQDRQLFAFGNGGSATNASHFITDLGKGASDRVQRDGLGRRFRCMSLNDNVGWLTALGNDYSYDDVFAGQLQNYANSGDLVLTMSVSGSSPNLVKAVDWANANGLITIALVGRKRGKLADLAQHTLVIDSEHYGQVEDAQMTIAHMLCYYFMEEFN